jgi:hypothetical protein
LITNNDQLWQGDVVTNTTGEELVNLVKKTWVYHITSHASGSHLMHPVALMR